MSSMMQNGIMIMPQMTAFGYNSQGNLIVKKEEFSSLNEKGMAGAYYKNYATEGDSKTTSSGRQESHNDSEKSEHPAGLKQGAIAESTFNANDLHQTGNPSNE